MLLALIAVVAGFAVLVWSADRFVFGAGAFAASLGVSPLVVGLTVVGMGTSAPELLVSGIAALEGNAGLGIGNAIGSNIANIALVLGATAVLQPLRLQSSTLRAELPALVVVTLAAAAMLWDGTLARADGGLLLGGLAALMAWLVYSAHRAGPGDALGQEYSAEAPHGITMGRALVWLAVGLALLLISSRTLVWGAVTVAELLGVSDLVIGLTIVAIGTSLPELATSLTAAGKGEADIAVGNVIGSNLMNLLGVLALPALISPGPVPGELLTRDLPSLLVLTIAMAIAAYGLRHPGHINRLEGGVLLAAFFAYQGWIVYSV